MGKVPNLLERAAFAANQGPAAILDVNGATSFRALGLAVRWGLLEKLQAAPRTAEQVARDLGLDPAAAASWLRLLAASGHLARRGEGYALSPNAAKWLRPGGPLDFSLFVRFWDEVVLPFWDLHLEATLRKGGPPVSLYRWMDGRPGAWEAAQAWFLATARASAPEVVAKARLPAGATRLLDVGGGHGYYSAAFARAHPGLVPEVLDGPAALRAAREMLRAERMEERVKLREGDYLRDPLGEGYDAVLLFNVLHAHQAEEAQEVLRRAAKTLKRGGKVFVLDQLAGKAPGPTFDTFLRMLDLNYRTVIGGRTYAFEEVASMMDSCGLRDMRKVRLKTPGNALVEGVRP